MAQLVQEAALVAVRKGHDSILQSDMDDAVDRLTVGPKRVGIELGHQGQCRRASAEVGVAMTSHLLRRYENANVERCDRISIIPRGQVLILLLSSTNLICQKHSFLIKPLLLLKRSGDCQIVTLYSYCSCNLYILCNLNACKDYQLFIFTTWHLFA